MLAKWLWRFATERNSWWRELIEIKYPNPRSIWQTDCARNGFSHSVWANISKVYDLFWKFSSMDPGNGTSISFWYDVWSPGTVLAEAFPRVAAAAADPNASLSDVASCDDGMVRWSLNLKYSLRGGGGGEQVSKGLFIGVQDLPAKQIWRAVIPGKVCFFLWLAYHNRILTIDNLMKRGWTLKKKTELGFRGRDISSVVKNTPLSEPVDVGGWFLSCILHAALSMEWLVAFSKVEKTQGENWLKEGLLVT
ncbi:unnamed protein product [Linum trigynum]|uniref:Reverse transcriptase zinc-binding domain-containing protein n=1 Tax=Linum trigynum TaxID=586398 RepID=A0AAV2DTU6_9ROSI